MRHELGSSDDAHRLEQKIAAAMGTNALVEYTDIELQEWVTQHVGPREENADLFDMWLERARHERQNQVKIADELARQDELQRDLASRLDPDTAQRLLRAIYLTN